MQEGMEGTKNKHLFLRFPALAYTPSLLAYITWKPYLFHLTLLLLLLLLKIAALPSFLSLLLQPYFTPGQFIIISACVRSHIVHQL
jgi:hypothetical protein